MRRSPRGPGRRRLAACSRDAVSLARVPPRSVARCSRRFRGTLAERANHDDRSRRRPVPVRRRRLQRAGAARRRRRAARRRRACRECRRIAARRLRGDGHEQGRHADQHALAPRGGRRQRARRPRRRQDLRAREDGDVSRQSRDVRDVRRAARAVARGCAADRDDARRGLVCRSAGRRVDYGVSAGCAHGRRSVRAIRGSERDGRRRRRFREGVAAARLSQRRVARRARARRRAAWRAW